MLARSRQECSWQQKYLYRSSSVWRNCNNTQDSERVNPFAKREWRERKNASRHTYWNLKETKSYVRTNAHLRLNAPISRRLEGERLGDEYNARLFYEYANDDGNNSDKAEINILTRPFRLSEYYLLPRIIFRRHYFREFAKENST